MNSECCIVRSLYSPHTPNFGLILCKVIHILFFPLRRYEQATKHMNELEKALERAYAAEKAMKDSLQTIEKQRQEEVELRKQLEDALQMAQAANKAKTSFLSNMSHDIRTPMNAIIGFTGLALMSKQPQISICRISMPSC